jgi:hypothetical protein
MIQWKKSKLMITVLFHLIWIWKNTLLNFLINQSNFIQILIMILNFVEWLFIMVHPKPAIIIHTLKTNKIGSSLMIKWFLNLTLLLFKLKHLVEHKYLVKTLNTKLKDVKMHMCYFMKDLTVLTLNKILQLKWLIILLSHNNKNIFII